MNWAGVSLAKQTFKDYLYLSSLLNCKNLSEVPLLTKVKFKFYGINSQIQVLIQEVHK